MDYLIAIVHLGGSLIATFALGISLFFLAAWELSRNEKKLQKELSVELGTPVDTLNLNNDLEPRVFKILSQRYSNELFRNRLSDFCGIITMIWSWLNTLVQFCVFVGVAWFTFSEDLETAIFAWSIVAISLFFCIVSIAFSYICYFLTGRYPNQARNARNMLSEYLVNNNKEFNNEYD